MLNIRQRLYFFVPALVAALVQHTLHETIHFVAARLLGEPVAAFRLLTNGWFTSQVVYATPVTERVGAHWLVIAWTPALITTLIGYGLYLLRSYWLTHMPLLNAGMWFATVYFLLVDPLYFAVLSPLFGGGDVGAVAAVGWPQWPANLAAGLVLIFNVWLVRCMRRDAKLKQERYVWKK